MNFVMFENGQEIGELTEWGYIINKSIAPKIDATKNEEENDICVFRSPTPLDITAKHSVIFNGKILIDIKILENSNNLYQALVKSKRRLPSQVKKVL